MAHQLATECEGTGDATSWRTSFSAQDELMRLQLYHKQHLMANLLLDPEDCYELAQALLAIYDELR